MRNNKKLIVKEGRLICYYPLEINKTKNINRIMEKIQRDQIVISEEKEADGCHILGLKDNYLDSLEVKEENTLAFLAEDGIFKSLLKDRNVSVDFPENISKDTKNILEKEDWVLSVGFESYNKVSLRVESNSKNELFYHLDGIDNKRNLSKRVYGIDITDYYMEYLLQPIFAKNKAGNDIHICLSLQIYENGMAIIKADIPIIDDNLETFYDDEYDPVYQEIKVSKYIVDGEHDYNEVHINNLSHVIGIYIKKLCKIAQVKMLTYAQFNHVLLIKCNSVIRNFDYLSNQIYEGIYRVLAAPIAEYKNIQDEMKLYCDENYWGSNGIRYYFGKTGKCVSIIDENLQEYVRKKETGNDRNTRYRVQEMMVFNIEYCINILLLEYINGKTEYWNSLKRGYNIENIKKKYCETELMILEMKEYCFGSVLELLEQMEQSMKYYLNKDLIDSKSENIEKIIHVKENKRQLILKKFIEIVGLVFTFIFGLPVIKDTITILNELFSFEVEGENIIIKASFFIWLSIVSLFMTLVIKDGIYNLCIRIKRFVL